VRHAYRAPVTYSDEEVRDAATDLALFRDALAAAAAAATAALARKTAPPRDVPGVAPWAPQHPQSLRWGASEAALADAASAARAGVARALADDCDTPAALAALRTLATALRRYAAADAPQPYAALHAASALREPLEVFGFSDHVLPLVPLGLSDGDGDATTAAQAQAQAGAPAAMDGELLEATLAFRAAVRDAALAQARDRGAPAEARAAAQRVLALCDGLRDGILRRRGVRSADGVASDR
jgi:cysteinyl-tRNA synthetase